MTVQQDASPIAGTSVVAAPAPRRTGGSRLKVKPPLWFAVPALAVFVAVVIYPNLQGFGYSFTNWDGFSAIADFVGLQNFTQLFSTGNSARAIINTFVLTAVVTVAQNVIGLLLALGVNSNVKSKYVLRLVFFFPVVLTPIVCGYLWKYLLTPEGSLNSTLSALGLGNLQQDWLGNPHLALYSVCAAIIWQGAGYSMVIYMAGLQGVPEELIEASALDGAGSFRRFSSITLPLIRGSIVINVLLTVIGNLKQFDTVFSMTAGGPSGASDTMATIVYQTAFQFQQYPIALAQGVVLTIIVGVIGFFQYRLTQRKDDA
ncbi:sugar ABC transporter permease [Curtobacterium sp. PhB136]|uniref:carbohydrate ABC transporter permease n=1 Tax=Curtobacterium sp. PhB136 TaxID=2485181 RepID=UPI001045C2BB|nr:sugar ABC transporter permease [Curtobacterium sp. PhB136]TCK59242.1 raffinose/stachyose/melibiose transport system permease protein [Curtobacterium sp. PhB136]